MSKKNNKKKAPKVRNYVAVEARGMSGSGKHADRRHRRRRTRASQKRAAVKDGW